MTLSRRSLIGRAAAAGFAAPLMSIREASAQQESDALPSGLVSGSPRPLAEAQLKGFLSKEQLAWHHDSHYGGALKSFVELDQDPTGSHRTRIAKANSVLLHEHYFENMTARATEPGEATRIALKRRFGVLERWLEDFRAAAKSCRGWAVLALHPVNGRLYNVQTDSHDDGPPWSGVPLVVVDVYEHSYYLDFQNRKGDYVDAFTDHLDWNVVERRLRAAG